MQFLRKEEIDMKKKVLTLICAAIMIMGMSMTVFAAPSPDSGSTGTSSSNSGSNKPTTDKSNSDEQDEQDEQEDSVGTLSTGSQTFNDVTIAEFAQVTTVAGATVKAVSADVAVAAVNEANALYGANTFVATVVDVTPPAGTNFPYTFTISNPNVWAGQTVTVLHQLPNGTWERITPNSVANNAVTLTTNSASPFAVVINTAASPASPRTQDVVLMVCAFAGVFAAGALMICKKRVQR